MKTFLIRDLFQILVVAAISTKLLYDTFGLTLLFESIAYSTLFAGAIRVLQEYVKHKSWWRAKQNFFRVAFAVLLTFNLLFFSLMMIDRSKSLYVIRWVGDCPGLSEAELLNKVEEELGQVDNQYLEQRIAEQVDRTIIDLQEDEGLELTPIGKVTYELASFFSRLFGLRGWTENSLSNLKQCQS